MLSCMTKINKIKICHICDRISGQADGVFTHLISLLKNLDETKFEQIVIFQGGEIIENELKKIEIKYFIVPELKKRFSIKSLIKIYKILKNESVDIIHAHLIKPYIISGLLNIYLRKILIFNYHGIFISSIYHNSIERFILNIFHFIIVYSRSIQIAIVPSQQSKVLLTSETKIFPRIEVYYNGFSNKDYNGLNIELEKELNEIKSKYFLAGIVARHEIEKRIDISLNLLKRLTEDNINVFFVYFGDGPLEEEMKLLAQKLSVNKNCKFYGYVKNAPLYFDYFDAILFTSDWEGFPLTIWESMASGVPIISTDVGGIKEIIEKEKCGVTYPKGDINSAAKIIEYLIKKPEVLKEMGNNGKVAIKTKYSIQNFISFFENLYTNIINENNSQ